MYDPCRSKSREAWRNPCLLRYVVEEEAVNAQLRTVAARQLAGR